MAKNMIIEGDYKGKCLMRSMGSVFLVLGFFKKIELTKNTVESYEVMNEDKRKSATSGAARAVVGGLLLGGVGALAGGLSAKNKGEYLVAIKFTDGKKSLAEIDEKTYKAIISNCF